MKDRGIIKWKPFNSVFVSKEIIKDLVKEKDKIEPPILSEDQIKIIEEKIVDAYSLNTEASIEYYYNGLIINLKGKIKYIDNYKKKIYLNNQQIYFKQIMKIKY